jgi:hypothetical protein
VSLLALTTAVVFLAAGDTTAVQPDPVWLQYGFIGLIAGGGLTFGLRTHRRVVRECDELSAEVRRLQAEHAAELTRVRDAHAAELRALWTDQRDKTLPVLVDTLRVLGEASALLRQERGR